MISKDPVFVFSAVYNSGPNLVQRPCCLVLSFRVTYHEEKLMIFVKLNVS